MAALGLVAYDGSGSSSEDEDEPMPSPKAVSASSSSTQGQGNQKTAVVNGASSSTSSSIKPSVIFSRFIDDEEDDVVNDGSAANEIEGSDDELGQSDQGVNPMWSKLLPEPKKAPTEVVEEEDDLEVGPIPPKKTYGDEELPQPPKPSTIPSLSSTKFKGKVRISIPFLNSLEDEPSDEAEKRKIVQPSQKGSGLFALLPQPKNSFGARAVDSNMFLKKSVPQSKPQTNSNDKTSDPQPQTSGPSTSVNRLIPDSVKNKLKRPAPSKLDEIKAKLNKAGSSASSVRKYTKDSDSEDDDTGDFFSLDSTETVDPEALEKLKLPMQNFDRVQQPPAVVAEDEEMETEDAQGYAAASTSRSEDLMKFIQPKRGKKEDVKIIDINADDLRPDNTEWLRNITDESQAPVRKSKGLGGMVKRKHQITYLAFEAKAREQELKNQWAQNRANKMATKNKYGF